MPEHMSPVLEASGRLNMSLDEIHVGVVALKGESNFTEARILLAQVLEEYPEDIWLTQQLALCTYKDKNLNPTAQQDKALKILETLDLRNDQNIDSETLALAGAIFKRKWEQKRQEKHLYDALAFYRAGYERNPIQDKGYGGVNAAYLLDILASRARAVAVRTQTSFQEANGFADQATDLRQNLVRHVPTLWEQTKDSGLSPDQDYWHLMTMAEIHFGLEQWTEAQTYLRKVLNLWNAQNPQTETTQDWQKETSFTQLANIAKVRQYPLPQKQTALSSWHESWQTIATVAGEAKVFALSRDRGKVGLALSGGGIRASLYHLGVLARLAEAGVLSSVEVLSTVSGGSIVGAHYYLELKRRLELNTTDELNKLTREDYCDAVSEVIHTFVAGVQKNLRTCALADFRKNLKMIFSKTYGRSHRLGELYEEHLYGRIRDKHPKDQARTMPSLLIQPDQGTFSPKFQNWERQSKVPILLLNTTSLNSGHNWHFTASWMGEPPGLLGGKVDKNERYRRLYYEEAPTEDLQNYRLGYAVAASAGVPGLFDPLAINGLYEKRTVRLVDGGVHDNQGIQGLLDEDCTHIFCSDASGQMGDDPNPSGSTLGVILRSTSIQGDRIREEAYHTAKEGLDTETIKSLFFVHLKKDLPTPVVNWIGCKNPSPQGQSPTTPYGVNIDIQKQLAAIRTDLDSFTEVESYALMLSGYQMTDYELRSLKERHCTEGDTENWEAFDVEAPREQHWPFLPLKNIMKLDADSKDPRRQDLGTQLDAGSKLLFKVWKLSPTLRGVSWVAGIVTALLLLGAIYFNWSETLRWEISIGTLTLLLLLTVGAFIFPLLKWINPQKAAREYLSKALIAFFGYIVAQIHLLIFDPIFIKRGKLSRLLNLKFTDSQK